ncbi:MAG: biotin--[acetyl-CoA-carboxylase] ligase [Gemmatimonadetes bacterium 13_2_20CM_2_65_7]|nr:MAG: biotin--[acetyl-CoA-carboxylase] ligase [Gemmatimonadetes bacterium 13_2_20CM_2_65_7]OLC38663.1 MAG: biotin--[acetyl-CoA-carboxylase] ligase [Gemmatimonadetes bacterium 13_1_40CM_4_65_7]OLD01910.1 MAG: biotin--[acetyl-CoA-carboxylase] ligase [Gemmatimonadetes bacterium 13_1_40CM_3_65_8]
MARVGLDGIPAAVLARRWGVQHCGVFRSLASSLDAIHDLGAQGAPAGSVVIAEEQTAGRGRDGRTWHSPVGGVWLGMLVLPPFPDAGVLSLRAGLVVADVVDELLGRAQASLKWPNDVLVEGRKLAGILCEARWQGEVPQWLALGLGINVANEIPAALADRAIALHELRAGVRRIDVLDRLVPVLRPLTAHRAPLTDSECAAFARRDWLCGRQIRTPLSGRAAGIRPDGALLVETDAGSGVVRDGHVELS